MAFHYKLSDDARVQVIGLFHWIGETSPDRADRWLRGLQKRIESLSLFPHRCPISAEGRKMGRPIRLLTYGKKRQGIYRILFEVTEDGVEILSVLHASRKDGS